MKHFIINSKDISRDSYVWNMIGSMFLAFQSVIILMILTRTIGLIQSGIFTIAYANANLFMNIGKYGMRYFQVSDLKEQFTFGDYRNSRFVTCVAAIVVSVVYVVCTSKISQYSSEKTWIILVMCVYKLADAIEDVYWGYYQQKGRLDIGSKALALRIIISILVFLTCVCITKNQLVSLVIATIISYVLMALFILWTRDAFITKADYASNPKQVWTLLQVCFPLFLGSFLSFYIGNAPKYAIDAQLSDDLQACYGFIAMPVFVIGLLNNFIFNPVIYKMSEMWRKKEYRTFLGRMLKQIEIIVLITLLCVIGAYILGIPVLSLLYNTNLTPYKTELLILLVGGGFLSLSGLLNTMITIIRFQKSVAVGYIIVSLLALVLSNPVVRIYGIRGAAVLYTDLMFLLSLCFVILFIVGIKIQKDKNNVPQETIL